MNVKHSMLFGLRSWCKLKVTAGQETQCGMAAKHCEGSREDVRRTPQQMSLCPFRLFSKCGGGHLRGGSSCHFLSHPLTFGILGCMPCTTTGSGMTTEGILLDKGTWGWDTEGYALCTQPPSPPPFVFFLQNYKILLRMTLFGVLGFCFFFNHFFDNWTDTVVASILPRRLSRSLVLMLGERGGKGKMGQGSERTWNLVSAARGERAEVFILDFDGSISAMFFL